MLYLEPANAGVVAYIEARCELWMRLADEKRIPKFSKDLRRSLCEIAKSSRAVDLIEAVTRLQNLGDTDAIRAMRRAVNLRLVKMGVRSTRGKRTAPGLLELVEEVGPLLLHFGVRLASNENSPLVRGLRAIAIELNIPGDPRDELRKQVRLHRAHIQALREHRAAVKAALIAAVQDGMRSLASPDLTPTAIYPSPRNR